MTFTNLTTSLSPWSLALEQGVELVFDDGTVVSAPSAPSASSFSISYTG